MSDEQSQWLLRYLIREELAKEKAEQGETAHELPAFEERMRGMIREELLRMKAEERSERKPLSPPTPFVERYMDEKRFPDGLSIALDLLQPTEEERRNIKGIVNAGYPGGTPIAIEAAENPHEKHRHFPSDERASRVTRRDKRDENNFVHANSKGSYLKALVNSRDIYYDDFGQMVATAVGREKEYSYNTVRQWFEVYTHKPELQVAFANVLEMTPDEQRHMASLPYKAPKREQENPTERSR